MKLLRGTDVATVGGLIIIVMGLFLGLKLEGIEVADVGQITAALIVFCGTAGAVLISMPLSQTVHALKLIPSVIQNPSDRDIDVINQVIKYARAARARGILSLEHEAEEIPDAFFRRAMRMIVDSLGSETIRTVLDSDIAGYKSQSENAAIFYETAAGYAPTLGVAGAALGLVQVMKHIEHVEQVGMGVAAAFVATIYGVLLANLILLPIATKIRARTECRVRICAIIREGVLAISTGMNPALIRLNLEALAQIQNEKSEHLRHARGVGVNSSTMFLRTNQKDRWLLSYADFVTLLFATFVLMYATAKAREHGTFAHVSGASATAVPATRPPAPPATAVTSNLLTDLRSNLKVDQEAGVVTLTTEQRGIVISLDDKLCFLPGEADVQPAAEVLFEKVARVVAEYENRVLLKGRRIRFPFTTIISGAIGSYPRPAVSRSWN